MNKKNKLLIVGDLHLRDNLSYFGHIADGRVAEKKKF